MSKFLVNHFARSVVKATRSQPKANSPKSNPEQDNITSGWKSFGIILVVMILYPRFVNCNYVVSA